MVKLFGDASVPAPAAGVDANPSEAPPLDIEALFGELGTAAAASDTHSNGWAESIAATDSTAAALTTFKKIALTSIDGIGVTFGGPYQYLKHHLKLEPKDETERQASLQLRDAFTNAMDDMFPELQDTLYHHESKMPPIITDDDMAVSQPVAVHITSLGYDLAASTKDPPGTQLFTELVDLYLTDGFKTSNEPLLVTQPGELAHLGLQLPQAQGTLATASLGYIKGLARTSSVLAFVHWCWVHGHDLANINPILHKSLLTIYVHYMPMDSKVDEALKNMKVSCAGSIRRPPNVIGIVSMIHKLVTGTMPPVSLNLDL